MEKRNVKKKRTAKAVITVLILLIGAVSLVSCGQSEIIQPDVKQPVSRRAAQAEQKVAKGIAAHKKSINVLDYDLKYSDLKERLQEFTNNHPTLFYIDGFRYRILVKETKDGKKKKRVEAIEPSYLIGKKETQAAKKKFNRKVSQIVRGAKKQSDFKSKILYVNNAICYSTNYSGDTGVPFNQTAYGVLVKGRGACQSYAQAFKVIMDRLDIPCEYRYSNDKEHIWNIVKYKGRWYHVDVTWNDSYGYPRYLLSKSHPKSSVSY